MSGARRRGRGGAAAGRDTGLGALVERAAGRRLVTVVAGPGWGTSSLLARWAEQAGTTVRGVGSEHQVPAVLGQALLPDGTASHAAPGASPQEVAGRVASAWDDRQPATLVIDDVHALCGSSGMAVVDHLWRTAGGLQVVVGSRRRLDLVTGRDRATGRVLELDATHMAMSADDVMALVSEELDDDPLLGARIHDATNGWPAAVRLLVDALHDVAPQDRVAALPGLLGATGPVARYVREVAMPEQDDELGQVLARLALSGSADAAQLAEVIEVPARDASDVVDCLVATGWVRPETPDAFDGRVDVAPVVRDVLREHVLERQDDGHRLVDATVAGLVRAGHVARGLDVLAMARRAGALVHTLERHGERLFRAGELTAIRTAVEAVPAPRRTVPVRRLYALALAHQGEWAAAMRSLQVRDGPDTCDPDADEALTVGLVHHLRGDLDAAIAAYARAPVDEDTAARGALEAWWSTAHWLRGEVGLARDLAQAALSAAMRHHDDHVLALAHTATALVAASDGDRQANGEHHHLALDAAVRAGDRLQEARVRNNLASRLLEQGELDAALRELDRALDLAAPGEFAMILGVARCNRAEALLGLGRLDEAVAEAEAARETFARVGSRHESYAHHVLGDARREQGDLVLAQLAYERCLRLAGPSGDRQGRVPALVGLARTLAGTDPDAAEAAARQALEIDDGMGRAAGELALGWVALARGAEADARRAAIRARVEAERRDDQAVVADACTLMAMVAHDPIRGLQDAARLWRQVDARIPATRAELGLARRSDDPAQRATAPELARRLADWGCAVDRGTFAHEAVVGVEVDALVRIRVLGHFVVEHRGRPVDRSAWGSRKARELLKALVVREGRRVTREELAHQLWPDEPYDAVANRLSVALSVVRGVLTDGPDGEPPLVADASTVSLDTTRVEVDFLRFRRLAEDGLELARDEPEAAVAVLSRAVEAYGGDLLEDDRDDVGLVDRREELRSLYASALRRLAVLVEDDDPDRTMRLLLRVLDRDPYDEPAHLGVCRTLLRAGRYGEARRRHALYVERMGQLGLPALPLRQAWSASLRRVARTA